MAGDTTVEADEGCTITLSQTATTVPATHRGKASAMFLGGILLSGWIMTAFHQTGGLAGWQWMFLIEGLLAVVLGVICFFYLADDIDSAKWLDAEEKARIKADVAAEAREKPLHSAREGLRGAA